jgi:hypothetical protein
MGTQVEQLKRYVADTLQVGLQLSPWSDRRRLPGFLSHQYECYEGRLNDVPLLFLLSSTEQTARSAGKHAQAIGSYWPHAVVFVFTRIEPDTRQRLIRAGIPFVVPGTQLYLPMLGLSLRERFHPRQLERARLSPSAQVVLLHALLKRDLAADTPSKVAAVSGYSAMAMVRAFNQLEATGLFRTNRIGRERAFTLGADPAKVWGDAQPVLADPVKRRLWLADCPRALKEAGLESGLGALATYSSLAATGTPSRAMTPEELKTHGGSVEACSLVSREEAELEIEVWSYSPKTLSDSTTVDRLSLYLSLREDEDERVQSALGDMMRSIQW